MGFPNKKLKEVIRIFFVWQDEKEESWLRKMALKGWHFVGIKWLIKYQFIKGEPQDYHYKLDFKNKNMDDDEYLQIFQDAGWEYVGNIGLWNYFRKLGDGQQVLEIYTDKQSKAERNKRILSILYLVLALNVLVFGLNTYHYLTGEYGTRFQIPSMSLLAIFLLAYAIHKIKGKNKILEEEI